MNDVIKVIVAGGRDFNDYILLRNKLDVILAGREVEIVSGCARGADSLGEKYAAEMGFPVAKFPADWDKDGKRAGFIRNERMAKYATHCVCFWDGVSRGTKSMIELAEKYKLPTRVIRYERS